MQYEVHYKTAASPQWELTNLGTFHDPIEADTAAHSWQAGYERAHGAVIETRVESAGWFDRMANAAPFLQAALVAMLEEYCNIATSGDAGYWEPENQAIVKQARAALALTQPLADQ